MIGETTVLKGKSLGYSTCMGPRVWDLKKWEGTQYHPPDTGPTIQSLSELVDIIAEDTERTKQTEEEMKIIDTQRMNEINQGKRDWAIFEAKIKQGPRAAALRVIHDAPVEIPMTHIWSPRS